jgi:hypothetical protein
MRANLLARNAKDLQDERDLEANLIEGDDNEQKAVNKYTTSNGMSNEPASSALYCKRCKMARPERAHHCMSNTMLATLW